MVLAQQSDFRITGQLTASCSNANTSCLGTAGSTVENSSSANNQGFSNALTGYSVASVTVSGTYAGITVNFEFSDDAGATWFQDICTRTDANIQETSEALPSNQVRAWDCGASGSSKFRARASAYGSGTANIGITFTSASIEPAPSVAVVTGTGNIGNVGITNTVGSTDPCQNPSVLKSSAKFTVTSTTAVQIAALSGTTKFYICGWSATIQGSATTVGTLQLESGTTVTNPCDTGTSLLSGIYRGNITANVPTLVGRSGPGTVYTSGAGHNLCVISTGTTIQVDGDVTFVQQ